MPRKYPSRRSPQIKLLPATFFGWVLTLVAGLLALSIAMLAYCMFVPVRWDGPGRLGALAFSFPLHLLVVTVASMVLAFLARGCRAVIAATLFSLSMFVTGVLAVAPSAMVWRRARQLDVPLSMRAYLDHAKAWIVRPARNESVVYGTARDGTELELDVWRTGQPGTGPVRPAILMVHGGAWTDEKLSSWSLGEHLRKDVPPVELLNRWLNDLGQVFDLEYSAPFWNRWLNELGYEVFDVECHLPPPLRWEDEIGNLKSALGWVASHAAEYHVDPARISAMGRSGGGSLALLLAYSSNDAQLPSSAGEPQIAVRSVISLYSPTDLDLLHRTSPSPGFIRTALHDYIGGSPEDYPDRYRALSPITHVSASSPPTMTLAGTRDRLVSTEDAEFLNDALAKAEVPHETLLLPFCDHGFDMNWGGFATQLARAKIQAFLAQHNSP